MVLRALLSLAVTSLMFVSPGAATAPIEQAGWQETRFWNGCDPGPFHPPPWPDPVETHAPPADPPEEVTLHVDLGPAADLKPALLGSGFNLEHALWSCPAFRPLLGQQLLTPFEPAIVRVDSGQLPAAPAELSAQELGPAVYESMLASAPYADSWRFFKRLNRAGVKVILGVWGGPAQFTLDGTRRGALDPAHYDDYVEYVATLVDFLVRREGIDLWATTIANEPDGGDGNQIPPEGLAYVAHRLAPRVAADGVKLYGPDTANGQNALRYLPLLLADPLIVDNLAFVGFHQYYPSSEVGEVVDLVHAQQPHLPVVVTEYTSFGFGDLDDGQEANAQVGFTLDIASTVLSHYQQGVDAALYWDAVDYLQPGHDAVTRWGFLRGPERDFEPRTRYYGMQQILQYLRPGARVLASTQDGGSELRTLAVDLPSGTPALLLVSQDWGPLDVTVTLSGAGAACFGEWSVTRTERGRRAELLGRVAFDDGTAHVQLPPRSITTLFPAGASPGDA